MADHAARGLAKADPRLGLYDSLATARAEIRRERRQSAIAKVLHRKIRSAVDPRTADIAIAVYDLDEIAARLADRADYDGLTSLIAADLAPARLAPQGRLTERPTGRRGRRSKADAPRDDIETSLNAFGPLPGGHVPRFIEPAPGDFASEAASQRRRDSAATTPAAMGRGTRSPRNTDRTSVRVPLDDLDRSLADRRGIALDAGRPTRLPTGRRPVQRRPTGARTASPTAAAPTGRSRTARVSTAQVSTGPVSTARGNGSGANGSGANGRSQWLPGARNGRHAVPGQSRARASRWPATTP